MIQVFFFRLVERFIKFPYVFTLEKGDTQSDGVGEEKLILHRTLTLAALRTKAVEGVLRVLRKDGIMPDERNEVSPLKNSSDLHNFWLWVLLAFSYCLEHS